MQITYADSGRECNTNVKGKLQHKTMICSGQAFVSPKFKAMCTLFEHISKHFANKKASGWLEDQGLHGAG